MKTVLIPGNFNIIHPGHLRLIKFAKSLGDKTIIGLYSNKVGGDATYVEEKIRLEVLNSLNWVDQVLIIDDAIEIVIKDLRPDIVLKSKEQELSDNKEKDIINSYGGKLLFYSGDIVFNTKELFKSSLLKNPKSLINYPTFFLSKHKIKNPDLITKINKFKKLKVCVIGDLIVDKYINCEPLGMSQEDPTIAVRPIDEFTFLGGAGIVAAHAKALGSFTHFISIVGNDDARNEAKEFLDKYQVKHHLIVDENRPTTVKTRYKADNKTLLRVNELHSGSIEQDLQEKILIQLAKIINDIDVLIFSDFNYGCIPQSLLLEIMELIKGKKIITAADSQCSSQIGDISRFNKVSLITPTEFEARISLRNNDDGLTTLGKKLIEKTNVDNIILKLGSQGLLIFPSKDKNLKEDKIEALNQNPVDISGAGDSLLISAALSLAAGASIYESGLIGSIAAAIQVGRLGNIPLELRSVYNIIQEDKIYSVV